MRLTSRSGSYENVPMWVSHIFHLISLVSSTRIMDRPVITLVAIKVIVIRRSPEARAITKTRNDFRRRWRPLTRVRHVFGNMTAYGSVHPVNQTSSSRRADYPVVNVALDQNLSTKLFPVREVNGVVVCFVQWRSCRDRNIYWRLHWPIWSWCDCV